MQDGAAVPGGGSSPRTRGAGLVFRRALIAQRFIPTYAGSRLAIAVYRVETAVHPHVRGEQSKPPQSISTSPGSSPRTRGAGWRLVVADDNGRFIPTYAGSSNFRHSEYAARAVHPHVRGEQIAGVVAGVVVVGSSPRTRGAGERGRRWGAVVRFIPTYAGSRWRKFLASASLTVHPHVRGEQGRAT